MSGNCKTKEPYYGRSTQNHRWHVRGVDSSVAAAKLIDLGYQVEGLFMKNWEEDDTETYCQAEADVKDAQAVCDTLDIKLHTVNFAAEYWDQVFAEFLSEYKAGRTPNPDILCNREIKFKVFIDYAKSLGALKMATGHYARIEARDQLFYLKKGLDPNKDQSYFLYALNQAQLGFANFPIGNLTKPETRRMAAQLDLTTANKKDSTGVCFIGERKFKAFLSRYLSDQRGLIKTAQGATLGEHDGLMYYTLGQRKGINLGGLKSYPESPWYVAVKDVTNNELIVVQGNEHPLLFKTTLQTVSTHWILPPSSSHFECAAKVRYRQTDQKCEVTISDENQVKVVFSQPQRAITPGQSVVFYQGEICLGGGIIA